MNIQSVSGNYCTAKPVMNMKDNSVICACGSQIKIVSLKTGELLSNFLSHTYPVTSIVLDTRNPNNVYTSSVDGTIHYWDLRNGKISNSYKVGLAVFDVLIPRDHPTDLYLVVSRNANDKLKEDKLHVKEQYKVVLFSQEQGIENLRLLARVSYPNLSACITVLNNEEYLITINKRKLFLWNVRARGDLGYKVIAEVPSSMTCVTATQNIVSSGVAVDGYVATGHENGAIILWLDLGKWIKGQPIVNIRKDETSGKKIKTYSLPAAIASAHKDALGKEVKEAFVTNTPPVCSTLHWHAHAVNCVYISDDNRNLCSGGSEGVLVVWQIGTSYKAFLPRLGGAVCSVSGNYMDNRVVLSTANNVVRVVNTASLKEDWQLRTIHMGNYCSKDNISVGLSHTLSKSAFQAMRLSDEPFLSDVKNYYSHVQIEPRSNCVVSNGLPSVLQFYDLRHNSYISTHEVTQNQVLSKPEKSSRMYIPTVTLFELARYDIISTSTKNSTNKTIVTTIWDDYLATVDVRKGEDDDVMATGCISLKIWRYYDCHQARNDKIELSDPSTSGYRLIVQVDDPHGVHNITSMKFTPNSTQWKSGGGRVPCGGSNISVTDKNGVTDYTVPFIGLATGASDGSVKFWSCIDSKTSNISVTSQKTGNPCTWHNWSWRCLYSFNYRDASIYSISFSYDCSLMAISHRNLITLWDPLSVALRGSVVIPAPNHIMFSKFIEPCYDSKSGGGCGEAYLVVGTKRSLSVINLFSLSVEWSLFGRFSCFAVASCDNEALLFPDKSVLTKVKCAPEDKRREARGWISAVELHDEVDASGVTSRVQSVMFFDPKSRNALWSTTQKDSLDLSSIISMSFYYNPVAFLDTDKTSGRTEDHDTYTQVLSHGLLYVTSSGELKSLGEHVRAVGTQSLSYKGNAIAKVAAARAPTLKLDYNNTEAGLRSIFGESSKTSGVSVLEKKKNWFDNVIGNGSAANVGAISHLFDAFENSLRKTSAVVSTVHGEPQVQLSLAQLEDGFAGAVLNTTEEVDSDTVEEESNRKKVRTLNNNDFERTVVPLVAKDKQDNFVKLLMESWKTKKFDEPVVTNTVPSVAPPAPVVTPSKKSTQVTPATVETTGTVGKRKTRSSSSM